MKKILLFFILILLCSCSTKEEITGVMDEDFKNTSNCLIDIKGEILYPGVYSIRTGTALCDIISMAGGFTENADLLKINLAANIENNQMIIIPSKSNIEHNNLININFASMEELCKLPGIGSAKADRIIKYRSEFGNFQKIEDIKKVSGFGEAIFSQIKDYICI